MNGTESSGDAGRSHSASLALEIQVLGGFRVRVGENDVPDAAWRLGKAKALVKLLALAPGHRLSRDTILETLWPGFAPSSAANNLRSTLHVARQALAGGGGSGAAFLQMEDDVLVLEPEGQVAVDLDTFEAAAGKALRNNGIWHWQAAAERYTGDVLPEDLYEEWAARQRERAREQYTAVLFGLARRCEVAGDWPQAFATWRRLIASDPTNEEAHQALMRLHALAGERRLALEQYRRLQHLLWVHLAVEPDPKTERLRQQIVDGTLSSPLQRVLADSADTTGSAGSGTVPVAPRRVLRGAVVYAWGRGIAATRGERGDAADDGEQAVETERHQHAFVPAPVRGLNRVVAVAAGYDHALALQADGSVWAWGQNDCGQLGIGNTVRQREPVRIPDLSGVAIAASLGRFSLALSADGSVWGWGVNTSENLGAESTDVCVSQEVPHSGVFHSCLRPTRVRTPTGVTGIAAGTSHCLAVLVDGMVWGWGANLYGQVIEGPDNPRGVPVQIHALRGVRTVAAGSMHSLALLADGTVLAWGGNVTWQLGDGTTASNPKPRPVAGLDRVVMIACGEVHNLAVRDDGTLWSWGQNGFGQLGDGTRVSKGRPIRIGVREGIVNVVAISASGYHSVAVTGDGAVWAWGGNTYGQLGDGTNLFRSTPVRVAELSGATAVAAGAFHSVAAQTESTRQA